MKWWHKVSNSSLILKQSGTWQIEVTNYISWYKAKGGETEKEKHTEKKA